ncbi:hypothetical protein RI367_000171 [Sorochytrium milnesiophthora]
MTAPPTAPHSNVDDDDDDDNSGKNLRNIQPPCPEWEKRFLGTVHPHVSPLVTHVTPLLLRYLDSHDMSVKLTGCRLLLHLLNEADASVLRRGNLIDVFRHSVVVCLTFTADEAQFAVFTCAAETMLRLAEVRSLRFTERWGEDVDHLYTRLLETMELGIAQEHIRCRTECTRLLRRVAQAMDYTLVKHFARTLEQLLHTLLWDVASEILSSSEQSMQELVASTVDMLQWLCTAYDYRACLYKSQILVGITNAWVCHVYEAGSSTQALGDALRAVYASIALFDVQGDVQRILAEEPDECAGLFSQNAT